MIGRTGLLVLGWTLPRRSAGAVRRRLRIPARATRRTAGAVGVRAAPRQGTVPAWLPAPACLSSAGRWARWPVPGRQRRGCRWRGRLAPLPSARGRAGQDVRAANASPVRSRAPGETVCRSFPRSLARFYPTSPAPSLAASEESLQLFRKRNIDRHRLARPRMQELQVRRVQEVPLASSSASRSARRSAPLICVRRAVQRVAHDRMPKRLQMHPDLVRPAGLDRHLDQRERPVRRGQPLQHVTRARPRCGRPPGASSCACAGPGRAQSAGSPSRRPSRPAHAPARDTSSSACVRENISPSLRCVTSSLATTIAPLVCLSSRCTIPGRSSPPTAES